jgi:hypothetical protein
LDAAFLGTKHQNGHGARKFLTLGSPLVNLPAAAASAKKRIVAGL